MGQRPGDWNKGWGATWLLSEPEVPLLCHSRSVHVILHLAGVILPLKVWFVLGSS